MKPVKKHCFRQKHKRTIPCNDFDLFVFCKFRIRLPLKIRPNIHGQPQTEYSRFNTIPDNLLCLWGGVNGCITVEEGTPDEVRNEVETALNIFSKTGGFILSPVDNVRINSPHSWKNVQVLIDAWKNCIRR